MPSRSDGDALQTRDPSAWSRQEWFPDPRSSAKSAAPHPGHAELTSLAAALSQFSMWKVFDILPSLMVWISIAIIRKLLPVCGTPRTTGFLRSSQTI
jgi:hypothetical protein